MNRVAAFVALAAAYEWFVVEAIVPEAIAAAIVGAIALATAERTLRTHAARGRLASAFARPLVTRVLLAIVTESFELLGPVLWSAVVRRRPLAGRWIALRYDSTDRSAAFEHGRRSIVIFGSNLTPNALPLDIDAERGRLVLHQLVPRREAAAGDPRYPM